MTDAAANGSRRAGGVPFQKDQLTKIFEVLGNPNSEQRSCLVLDLSEGG
jgi:hypothetical protein